MTSLTEARKAVLSLKKGIDNDFTSIPEDDVLVIHNYLESQVAESVEIADLRARLARSESFVNTIKSMSAVHSAFEPQPPAPSRVEILKKLRDSNEETTLMRGEKLQFATDGLPMNSRQITSDYLNRLIFTGQIPDFGEGQREALRKMGFTHDNHGIAL